MYLSADMYGAVGFFFGKCCIVEMIFAIGSGFAWSFECGL